MFVLFVMRSYLIEVRGLKRSSVSASSKIDFRSYLIEVRGLKRSKQLYKFSHRHVVSYRGTWVETFESKFNRFKTESYLIEVRGLKQYKP